MRWQYAVHPLPLLVVAWHGQIEATAVALGLGVSVLLRDPGRRPASAARRPSAAALLVLAGPSAAKVLAETSMTDLLYSFGTLPPGLDRLLD